MDVILRLRREGYGFDGCGHYPRCVSESWPVEECLKHCYPKFGDDWLAGFVLGDAQLQAIAVGILGAK
jgi:hypothetical protein